MEGSIRKSLLIFSITTVLCGWLGVLVDHILTEQPEGSSLGMLIWIIAPLLSAVLLVTCKKDGWKSFGIRPKFKGNIKWYLLSLMIFPSITFLLMLIGITTNWVDVSKFVVGDFVITYFSTFILYFIKNIFEEFSWRGYLTERLVVLKCSDIKIYTITTAVWFLWHIPYYLVLLSNVNGSRYELLFSAFITLACWDMMFTELYRITGSSWPCGILHAASNALIVIYNYISIQKGKGIFLNYDFGIISLIICICLGILLRKYRIRKDLHKGRI